MNSSDWDALNDLKIGILGCGHLGQAIARSLINRGLDKANLLLSCRGNPVTYEKLQANGLAACLADNETLFAEAGIVLITIRPQDVLNLRGYPIPGKALVVSCMAGISAQLLGGLLGTAVYRMMFSGPDTLYSGNGVAAMIPEHEHLKLLLRAMRVERIRILTEADLDVFTAGVCLPAAILQAGDPVAQRLAIGRIGAEYPLLADLYAWAVKALPVFHNGGEKEAYIRNMITKGGVTEAMMNSLGGGEPLDDALRKGIARAKALSAMAAQAIRGDNLNASGHETHGGTSAESE
jgi:pyrroline-5-carboxylate reductase